MNMRTALGILIVALVALASSGCAEMPVDDGQPDTVANIPTTKLDYSLERVLINMWLEDVGDPNNVMWLYHFSDTGVLLAEYPVVGKPVSMTKSNEPKTRIADYSGSSGKDWEASDEFIGYRKGTEELTNPSGTYGGDLPGLFFYTPDGALHMIHNGIIHVSENPQVFNDAMVLTYAIDTEKKAQEEKWESELKKKNPIVEKAKELEKQSKSNEAAEAIV